MKKSTGVLQVLFSIGIVMTLSSRATLAQDTANAAGLKFSIFDYRNGEYRKTIEDIAEVLPVLSTTSDSLIAMKYLAFSYGMLNMIDSAKENFRIALKKWPDMEIDTLECPPNIAIIFTQVKTEDGARFKTPGYAMWKSPVLPIVLLTAAVAAGGAGGYFFYNGMDMHEKYRSVKGPYGPDKQELMNEYHDKSLSAYSKSAGCGGVSAVLISVSIYLILKEAPVKNVTFENCRGMPTVAISF